MKMKTLALSAALLALATGGAFAQTGGSTSSQSTMSQPTGTGQTPAQKTQTQKDQSPASTNSGTKQEK